MTPTAPTGVRRVAFGEFQNWSVRIRDNLNARYAPDFVDLNTTDLDAYDAVVPVRRTHYEGLARRPDLRGRKFLHPSPDAVALCHDKLDLAHFLAAEGFGEIVPALRAPGPPYPYVWKRRQGAFGRECVVVDGPQVERDLDLADPDWFAQDLAAGMQEFATYMLRAGGQIRYVSTFIHQMGRTDAVLGDRHQPTVTHFRRGCPHGAVFAAILERLDYEGVACFDFKLVGERLQLFEINPRVGGSLLHDMTAYVDAYIGALAPRER